MGCVESVPVQESAHTRPAHRQQPTRRPQPQTQRQPQRPHHRQQQQQQVQQRTAKHKNQQQANRKNARVQAAKNAQLQQRVNAKKRTVNTQARVNAAKQSQMQQRMQAKKSSAAVQASKQQKIQQRVLVERQAPETLQRQQELKEEKIAELEAELPPVPPTNALKRDINAYRKREANFTENQEDTPEDPEKFLKQAEELIPAEVRMISGCEDGQTSADVLGAGNNLPNPHGRAGGAATSALLELLYENEKKDFTFQDALMALREKLQKQGHSQVPQLTSSRPLDLDDTSFSFYDPTNPQGQRRALLVGINYVGQQGQLRGCHNDALRMKDYLVDVQGFPEENVTLLTDDGSGEQPTKQRMIGELKRLTELSKAGDSVFFHYSGHGGFLEADQNSYKQGQDQYDQTLIPLDHRKAGQIRDFNIFNHFVRPMPKGVKVTCLMDCCHSGSVLDLPYSYKPTITEDGRGVYRQQTSWADMAGMVFLGILGGMVLDELLFGPMYTSIEQSCGYDIGYYHGMHAAMLQEDLITRQLEAEVERRVEEEIEKRINDEVEKRVEEEIEKEVERALEEEIEREIQRELEEEIEREIQRELEEEIEREIQRELEKEMEAAMQREMEAAIQREMEAAMQREMEAALQREMEAAMFDDFW